MAQEKSNNTSFPYKTLLIGVGLAGLIGMSALAVLWPRASCEGIFEQTAPKVAAHLEIIKNRGDFAVSHETIQELSESSQKVGLHLKTCCSVLEDGKLNPAQFQQCLDKASAYDRKIALVAQQVTEAAEAKEKGTKDIVENKMAHINQTIQAATNDAEKFMQLIPTPKPAKDKKTRDLESEPNNTAAQATELRLSGEILGEVSTTEDPDYYKLVTTKHLRDRVLIRLQNLSESLRPSMTLYNQKKSEIEKVYDYTYGADIEYRFTAEPGGYYFIKVVPWYSTGKYKLIVSYGNAYDEFEPNDNPGAATILLT